MRYYFESNAAYLTKRGLSASSAVASVAAMKVDESRTDSSARARVSSLKIPHFINLCIFLYNCLFANTLIAMLLSCHLTVFHSFGKKFTEFDPKNKKIRVSGSFGWNSFEMDFTTKRFDCYECLRIVPWSRWGWCGLDCYYWRSGGGRSIHGRRLRLDFVTELTVLSEIQTEIELL